MDGFKSVVKIGITGTRNGMTEYQFNNISIFLTDIIKLYPNSTFSHGDCIGVDVQVAEIAAGFGFTVVAHPPVGDELRAFHKSHIINPPLTHFARNRNIVNSVDLLLVVPYQKESVFLSSTKGGTKYTHDYAKKVGKPTLEFYPEKEKSESFDLGDF